MVYWGYRLATMARCSDRLVRLVKVVRYWYYMHWECGVLVVVLLGW